MRHQRTALATALLAACATTTTACADTPDLAGHTYVAEDVTNHDLVDGSRLVLAFTEDSVGAQPGCNSMSAPATWDDDVLHLTGELTSTRMACPEDLMAQDDWFADLLSSEPTLHLAADDTLLLGSGDVTVLFTPEA
ncbi:META domain-containing protein [Isoptericola jiangsuensis]|uniref:META domain-containing protein n=1 Tax=Isoptericola jiangsuensis TaxID=548579 RepID=UPI003AAEBAEE